MLRWSNKKEMLEFIKCRIDKPAFLRQDEKEEIMKYLDEQIKKEENNNSRIPIINNKGLWCGLIEGTCQEGNCNSCEPYIKQSD